jgi:redox-sensitive bicupin YhaK (pirin superfamily)
MITVRKAEDRGFADHGWLQSRHTFSFADYFDPKHVHVSVLRVINDDRVAPGAGFPPHPHRDMEIISYVLEGALEHKDSMGNGSIIRPGEIQRMSAGTGVTHSEYNASDNAPVHFLQIWIFPREKRLEPGYEQKEFPEAQRRGRLRLVASPDGRDGSITIHQDTRLFAGLFSQNDSAELELKPGRIAYLHVARGEVRLNDLSLHEGDGARIESETGLTLHGIDRAEVLLFDLPGTTSTH